MKKRASVFAIWTVLFVMVAGTAVAVEGDTGEEDSTEMQAPVVTPTWHPDEGVIVVEIGTGEVPNPCEGVEFARGDDGELVITTPDGTVGEGDVELPPGCIVQDGTGPNGQKNHGSMVSAVARNVSPHDLPFPKGWLMREVAKLKPPKGDDVGDDDGDDDEGEEKPEKVKKEKKEKREKPEKPERGKKGTPPGKNK